MAERGRDQSYDIAIATAQRVLEGRSDVVPVSVQDSPRTDLIRAEQDELLRCDELAVVPGVTIEPGLGLAGTGQPVRSELPQRLEHAEPGTLTRLHRLDHRLGHERIDQVDHIERVDDGVVGAHRFGGLELEPAHEHRQPLEQRLLVGVHEVIGPLHPVAQGLVTLDAPAPCTSQQPEPVVETREQLAHTEAPHPGRSQLDAERHPVEPLTDLTDDSELIRSRVEARGLGTGPIAEQPDRRRVDARHGDQVLGRQRQGLATGAQDMQPLTASVNQPLDHDSDRIGQVLAVVDNHEGDAPREHLGQVIERIGRLQLDACRVSDGVNDTCGLHHSSEIAEPDAVSETLLDPAGCLDREASLADATWTHEGHQALGRKLIDQALDLLPSANEAGSWSRQVPLPDRAAGQGREVRDQPVGDELEDPLRTVEITKSSRAQIDEDDPRLEVCDEVGHSSGYKHLTASRQTHQPRGAIDRRTEVVAFPFLRLADMQPRTISSSPEGKLSRWAPSSRFGRTRHRPRPSRRAGELSCSRASRGDVLRDALLDVARHGRGCPG